MSAVVTGAGGHIGATLVRALLEQGRKVVAVDLEERGAGLEGLEVEFVRGDIRDAEFLQSVIHEGDTVFHLASIISTSGDKGGLVYSVNVEGARNVAEVCLKQSVKCLVHFSSVHAYDIDKHDAPVTEQTALASKANCRAHYNISKAMGQEAVRDVAAKGLRAVVVNPCGVVGPYDFKASRMGKVLRAVARGRNRPVGAGGFNWVDVRDVVAGALLAEEKGRSGECYILGGHYLTNQAIAELAGSVSGQPVPAKPISMWVLIALQKITAVQARLTGKPPFITQDALDALRANADLRSDKAKQELGYSPRPMADTIGDTVDWYKKEGIVR